MAFGSKLGDSCNDFDKYLICQTVIDNDVDVRLRVWINQDLSANFELFRLKARMYSVVLLLYIDHLVGEHSLV